MKVQHAIRTSHVRPSTETMRLRRNLLEIMLKKYNQKKYGGPEYEDPYEITTVNDNGTVRIQWHKFYDVINIRNIKPNYQ